MSVINSKSDNSLTGFGGLKGGGNLIIFATEIKQACFGIVIRHFVNTSVRIQYVGYHRFGLVHIRIKVTFFLVEPFYTVRILQSNTAGFM